MYINLRDEIVIISYSPAFRKYVTSLGYFTDFFFFIFLRFVYIEYGKYLIYIYIDILISFWLTDFDLLHEHAILDTSMGSFCKYTSSIAYK